MSRDLGRRIISNTAALIGGRGLIALGRLAIAGVILRHFGTGTFAEYAVLFGILSIAEWVADFGTTEIYVREVTRPGAEAGRLQATLLRLKVVQVPLAAVVLLVILLLMRYPHRMVEAGMAGGISLLFFAGVLVYRAIFRASLTMEREVAAELVSVGAMVPMILFAASHGGGLTALLLCHAGSRAVFFVGTAILGRNQFSPSLRAPEPAAQSLRAAAPIGVIGILVAVYEAIDLLVLSKSVGSGDLASYSAAQRLIWPVLIGLAAVGQTIYPVAAAAFARGQAGFEKICQRGVEAAVTLAAFPLCAFLAAPQFFLGLIGPELRAGAPILRVLALVCFAKAISATVGPLLYAVGAQRSALRFIAVALVAKLVMVTASAWTFGALGVAFATLLVEIGFATVPAVSVLRRSGGVALQWSVPLRVTLLALGIAYAVGSVIPGDSAAAAISAPLLFALAATAARLVRPSELQTLVRWRTS